MQVLWVGMHARQELFSDTTDIKTTDNRTPSAEVSPGYAHVLKSRKTRQHWYAIARHVRPGDGSQRAIWTVSAMRRATYPDALRPNGPTASKRRKVWEPLIHNLLFIRTSADRACGRSKRPPPCRSATSWTAESKVAHGDSGAARCRTSWPSWRHAERARRNRRATGRGSGKREMPVRVTGGHVRRNRRPLHPPQGTQQGRRGDHATSQPP